MATIHVREKFHFTDAGGKATPYAAGTHTGVPDEVANHPFVKAHCDATAMEASGMEAAAALTKAATEIAELHAVVSGLTTEHDAQADRISTLTQLVTALEAERDGLLRQTAELGNQIAELQAGGDAPPAAVGKKK